MAIALNNLMSPRFAVSPQGGRAHCATCKKELRRGECIVFVSLNDKRYFYLGVPVRSRPFCCQEVRNVIAIFDKLEDAVAAVETYRTVFMGATNEEELLANVPLKEIFIAQGPKVVQEGWREAISGVARTTLH